MESNYLTMKDETSFNLRECTGCYCLFSMILKKWILESRLVIACMFWPYDSQCQRQGFGFGRIRFSNFSESGSGLEKIMDPDTVCPEDRIRIRSVSDCVLLTFYKNIFFKLIFKQSVCYIPMIKSWNFDMLPFKI